MKKEILLLEPWDEVSGPLVSCLAKLSLEITVVVFVAESDFRSYCATQIRPPFAVIADTMVPWNRNGADQDNQPEYVKAGTFRRAGARCRNFLRSLPGCQEVPWIYFTMLDLTKVDPDVSKDPFCECIVKSIHSPESFREVLTRVTDIVSTILAVDSQKMQDILRTGLATPLEKCTESGAPVEQVTINPQRADY